MNKSELIQSLIDEANNLPHRDDNALNKLKNRAKMILRNIVLLSPDYYGYSKNQSPNEAKPRSRQNVIFELGFFIGKLGRRRVVVIYREVENFEFPSDYSGVLYKIYDSEGNWKSELVKELKACGYNVSSDSFLK